MYKVSGPYINTNINLLGVNKFHKSVLIPEYCPAPTNVLGSLEIAGNIHKEVRRYLQPYLEPGIKLVDIAKLIESKTIELCQNYKTINNGIGFPSSLSLNDCAAHWHPMTDNDTTSLKESDVLKIDFGVEINGWICDSAFTICFNDEYMPLLNAVKESTYTGIKTAGVDVDINDWSCGIQEVMESYEITLNGKTSHIKTINNLAGHNILHKILHGGCVLPCINMKHYNSYKPNRFKEGVYAIETFGSTGHKYANEKGEATLYMLNSSKLQEPTHLSQNTVGLWNNIYKSFETIPFTDRYLQKFGYYDTRSLLSNLINEKYVNEYKPLVANPTDLTAQYEHTIYLGEGKKHIISDSSDY